ncbi:MAG: 16S rRNA (uracil(1498)-N(3))-methyltransferase [Chloroflexi bacterium]|nr:MAG: 16S rRNA (uracil(1498)-N(3))-methyltransferase [Chloroflexota bacterium]
MTHRFFVEEDVVDQVVLGGEQAHQIANVLRLKPGEQIMLVRNGAESLVVLESVDAAQVRGRCISKRSVDAEPRVRLTIALPILRGNRTEEVIEAVTQLGVSRIVPFVSARSVVRSLPDAKRERWMRVAREAAETARRGRVPVIEEARDWEKLFDSLDAPVLVAWESEVLVKLEDALPQARQLSLVIGPEGGIGLDEIEVARRHDATTVSLGRRNLRSETAATAAVARVVALLDR